MPKRIQGRRKKFNITSNNAVVLEKTSENSLVSALANTSSGLSFGLLRRDYAEKAKEISIFYSRRVYCVLGSSLEAPMRKRTSV